MPVPAPTRRRRRLPRAVMFGVVLLNWETQARIDEFVPGKHDRSDQLLIPEKLYERAPEIGTLLSAFDRVVGGTDSVAIRLLGADIGRYPVDRKFVKLVAVKFRVRGLQLNARQPSDAAHLSPKKKLEMSPYTHRSHRKSCMSRTESGGRTKDLDYRKQLRTLALE